MILFFRDMVTEKNTIYNKIVKFNKFKIHHELKRK